MRITLHKRPHFILKTLKVKKLNKNSTKTISHLIKIIEEEIGADPGENFHENVYLLSSES